MVNEFATKKREPHMLSKIKKFISSEEGAVTVDWVVLTAAVVLMAGVVIISLLGSTETLGDYVGLFLSEAETGEMGSN
jgi:uncharacterized protein (UPF0333 family)